MLMGERIYNRTRDLVAFNFTPLERDMMLSKHANQYGVLAKFKDGSAAFIPAGRGSVSKWFAAGRCMAHRI